MANSIAYATKYLAMLDRIYKAESTTAILESDRGGYRFSATSEKTIYLKKLSVQGLGTYSRSTGYVAGDTTVAWAPYTFSIERGRKYNIDTMDEKEAQTSVAEIMAEIMRTQIIPEIDAYRFSKIVSLCGLDASVNLTYDTVVNAIDTATQTLDDAEVPTSDRILFVSNECSALLKQSGEWTNNRVVSEMNTKLNREITLFDNMPIVKVPVARFKSAFTFYDGVTGGQEAGGFVPAGGAKTLNFMILPLSVVIAIIRHFAPKLVKPEFNTDGDGYVFGYRLYHDLFIPDNKLSGVYIHSKA